MAEPGAVPEFECFDTGIVRSRRLFVQVGLLQGRARVQLRDGRRLRHAGRPGLLPLLIEAASRGRAWQAIAIGREEIWPLHRRAAELGGHLRTGLEDTFYLPDGSKAARTAR